MKIIKKLSEFVKGLDHRLFLSEVRQTSFGANIWKLNVTDTHVELISDVILTEAENNELDSIILNHVPLQQSELEKRSENILDVDDYFKEREELKLLAASIGYDNMTGNERVLCSKYCLLDSVSIITYYMGLGMTYADALSKHKVLRAIDITRACDALINRLNSAVIRYIAVKYLSEADALEFTAAIRGFAQEVREAAHLGSQYGTITRDGIMDYIESTGSYVGGGLSSYTFEEGYTYEECKVEFKEYIVYGNKPAEFDVFSAS